MTGTELLAWLASPSTRECDVEAYLGFGCAAPSTAPPGDDLVGHHASGVASILQMIAAVPVTANDVFVDLGAGLGKVALLTRLLTGATVRGIEIQAALVEQARAAAVRLGVDVAFIHDDARDARVDDGTIFYLYTPFTGPVLAEVLERLRVVAERHAIVVCALGIDLDRIATWLCRRPIDSFWLAVYDSAAI